MPSADGMERARGEARQGNVPDRRTKCPHYGQFLKRSLFLCCHRSTKYLPGEYERREAQRRAGNHEGADHDVPHRAIAIEPWEIERVQAVVKPSGDPVSVAVRPNQTGGAGIDVKARRVTITQAYEHDRQRPDAMTVEVIAIVL